MVSFYVTLSEQKCEMFSINFCTRLITTCMDMYFYLMHFGADSLHSPVFKTSIPHHFVNLGRALMLQQKLSNVSKLNSQMLLTTS